MGRDAEGCARRSKASRAPLLPAIVVVATAAATATATATATTTAATTAATTATATATAAAATAAAAAAAAEAAAAAAPSSAAATTTRSATATRTVVRNADVDGATVKVGLVQSIDCCLRSPLVIELDEAKASGAPGLAIDDDGCAENLTELGERLLQLMVHGGIGQIAHEKLRAHSLQTRVFLFVSLGSRRTRGSTCQHLAESRRPAPRLQPSVSNPGHEVC